MDHAHHLTGRAGRRSIGAARISAPTLRPRPIAFSGSSRAEPSTQNLRPRSWWTEIQPRSFPSHRTRRRPDEARRHRQNGDLYCRRGRADLRISWRNRPCLPAGLPLWPGVNGRPRGFAAFALLFAAALTRFLVIKPPSATATFRYFIRQPGAASLRPRARSRRT